MKASIAKITATTADAYQLVHDGILALAEVEAAGMRVDTELLDRTIRQTGEQIKQMTEELKRDEVWRVWKRRYGERANLGSRAQLGKVLFSDLGHQVKSITRTGRAQVNEEALEQIDLPFVKQYLRLESIKKLKGTYLEGVRREVVDGLLHCVFNLHLARTHRSSAEAVNFQNFPIRDKEQGKPIRSCFVPRPGHVIVEIDYGSLEVRIAAAYHRDPTMLRYINDPTTDMHRDSATECYALDPGEIPPGWWKQKGSGGGYDLRFYAKNQFVFPEFYGSYWAQCAPNMWGVIDRAKMALWDGTPLKQHLRSKGIRELGPCGPKEKPTRGSFAHHIQQVEQDFWGRRFKVYAQWKQNWYKQYHRTGRFRMFTGFEIAGVLSRNDVINYPVQGAAFHCTLWSLIQLVRWLRKYRMRSVIVGQIHDSIVADVHREELTDYLQMAKQVMTEDIRQHWSWICVPLEVEAEVGEQNWFEKAKVDI